MHSNNITYLRRADKIYQALLRRINHLYKNARTLKQYEEVIALIQTAAAFIIKAPTGRFSDGSLENILLQIGQKHFSTESITYDVKLETIQANIYNPNRKKTILHIVSWLPKIGGHLNLLTNYILNDKESNHSLVLTGYDFTIVNQKLKSLISDSGGIIYFLKSKDYLSKAQELRNFTKGAFDLVILHINNNDVVPILAYADRKLPVIAYMNHSDHLFSLGTSVSDITIDFREWGMDISKRRRNIKRPFLLPIPLNIIQSGITKNEARKKLDIPLEQTLIISMGHRYKFIPNTQYDFFSTCAKILNMDTNVLIKIIGVGVTDDLTILNYKPHSRLELLGEITEPMLYQIAADYFIEPMPVGSLTALLESIGYGCYPLFKYDSPGITDTSKEPGFLQLVTSNKDENDLLDKFNVLEKQKDYRENISQQLKASVYNWHQGNLWKKLKEEFYYIVSSLSHEPQEKPIILSEILIEDKELTAFIYPVLFTKNHNILLTCLYKTLKPLSIKTLLKITPLIFKTDLDKNYITKFKNVLHLLKLKYFEYME